MSEPAHERRGVCPGCGRWTALRGDGTVVEHRSTRAGDWACSGSGSRPAPRLRTATASEESLLRGRYHAVDEAGGWKATVRLDHEMHADGQGAVLLHGERLRERGHTSTPCPLCTTHRLGRAPA